MRKQLVVPVCVFVAVLLCPSAWAVLIQEDFEGLPLGPGAPEGWFEGRHGIETAEWEIIEFEGRQVLKGVSGAPGEGSGSTGPDNQTGWFVENMELQVSLRIEEGRGGGIGVGQFDRELLRYVGNSYHLELRADHNEIRLNEEGLSAGTQRLAEVAYPLEYEQWYDVRLVATGTTFQVWFRPRTTEPWAPEDMIFDVPHDILHPGHKSYVEGFAGVWTQDGGGPSTMLFDDFRLDAMPFPEPTEFEDDFEDTGFTLANWTAPFAEIDFAVDGGQVLEITAGDRPGGALVMGEQFYTHGFTLQTSVFVDEHHSGGVVWGWDGTAVADTGFALWIGYTAGDNIGLRLEEVVNSESTRMAEYYEPREEGVFWYTVEVLADFTHYQVRWWKEGDPRPELPAIHVPQDVLHPGYRMVNTGGAGLYTNPNRTAYFDDFYFVGTRVPAVNTEEGSDVTVQPSPEMDITFSSISEGGTTSVQTSDTAPGPGPGGLQFQGTYYNINTTAVYDGPITICLTYDDTGMTEQEQQNLKLMHWVTADQVWVDITESVDTANNRICGVTDSLSVFAVATLLPVFEGFLPPVTMPSDGMRVFNRRSTVPVKFRLLEPASGEPVPDATATIWAEPVEEGEPSGEPVEIESTLPHAGNTFRYDSGSGQYIFNLGTRRLSPGVYRLHVEISVWGGTMERWVDIGLR